MTPPPEVEIRSSSAFTTTTTTAAAAATTATASSSLQNPSRDPNFDCRNNLPGNDFQYGIDSGTVFGNGRGFTSRAAPGRARPRLVKVRRPAHGRYRAVSGESSSGFNPFLSSSDCAVPGKVDEFTCTSNGGGDGDVGNSKTTSSNGFWEKCGLNTADFSNGSFVFGSSSSSVEAFVFGAKKRECGDNEGKPVSGTESVNPGNLDDDGNGLEVKQCPSLVNADVGNVDIRNEVECENQSDTGQEFGGMGKNLKSNSNFEDRESRISVEEPDSSGQVGISGSSFVFGASWFIPMSSLNKVREESGGSTGNWVSRDTETHKVKDVESKVEVSENVSCNKEGNIVFGSGSEERSSFMGCVAINCTDSVQTNHGSFVAKPQNSNLDSGIDDKCKFTSYEEDRIAGASSKLPSFNLPNEMEKLKIENRNVDAADRKHSSNDDTSFVFRSSKKTSALSNGGLGTTRESSSESFVDAARGTGGAKFASSKENANGSVGASVGISSSESFTFQAGLASGFSQSQVNGDTQSNGAAKPSSSSLTGLHSQMNLSTPEVPTVAEAGKEKNESSSAGASVRLEVPFSDFKQPTWDPSRLKESLFPDSNTKLEFGVSGSKKNRKSKKIRVKLKQPSLSKLWSEQTQVKNLSTAQETTNSPGSCSPMDFSPYEDTTTAEQFSLKTTDVSTFINSYHEEFFSHSAVASDAKGDLGLGITKDNEKSRVPAEVSSGNHHDKCFSGHYEGFIYGAEGANSGHNAEQVCRISEVDVASADKCDAESSLKVQFGFASGLEDIDGRKFFFSASSSEHDSSSTRKRLVKKKNRKKAHCDPFVIAPCPYIKDQASDICTSQRKENMSCSNEPVKQGSISSTATQEACEMWRLRGNQAYKNGDMSKAEDFYTRGIDSVPSNGTLGCCLEPLVICYSNRAATRMSLGNVRGAIKDCARAAALDPNFLKVQMRAANCHLLLGEVNDAKLYFMKCLESGPAVCLDRRITIEAADGLQKAQKVADCTNHCTKLLEQRTPDVAVNALDLIAEGLSISPYSERLLDMKAEFMFMLRKYEEVIQLCEQTVYAAERNFVPVGADDESGDIGTSGSESYSLPRLWRWRLISRSHFYLGRLEVALDLLAKIEQMGSINDKYASKIVESALALSVTIRNLLHHKNAGNEAVQSGKYAEAIEHYTAAISSNVESRSFAAICFCNRAAAHQALSQVADAIADCSLAMALDGNYSKAISRRASLHELIRDYGQASSDLQRLISMLENQSDEKARQSGTPGRSSGGAKELRQARRRLLLVEENAKKEIPLDLYLILGVKESDTAADIKKAYRKAALKHHPDKAGQFLARSESGDEGRLWKDIIQEVHTHADRLFKMIGEAYAVLSEPSKRSQYDLDEEIRKATKRHNASSSPSKKSTAYTHPFERSDYGRNWQNWKTHGNSRSRW